MLQCSNGPSVLTDASEHFAELYQSRHFNLDGGEKVFYTHIARGEQGAIGLRHVHVVVVILEL